RRLAIFAVALYLGVLVLAPLAMLVSGALGDGPLAALRAIVQPDVLAAIGRTLLVAAVAVAMHAVFGTALAWVLVRHRFRGRRVANALIDLPFAVSPVVAGYMLILLFGRRGVLGPLVAAAGARVVFAMPGIIFATVFLTLPLMVRELVPAIEALGRQAEEAAATLGATPTQTFVRVTAPALRTAFVLGLVATFARALGEFGAVLVVGGGLQGSTETATLFIYRALEERETVPAYSLALVLSGASVLL